MNGMCNRVSNESTQIMCSNNNNYFNINTFYLEIGNFRPYRKSKCVSTEAGNFDCLFFSDTNRVLIEIKRVNIRTFTYSKLS